MRPLLILRPQPGADATATAARHMGLTPEIIPLFIVRPRDWSAPDAAQFDALMLTSANAPRHAGPGLAAYAGLPLWCVGEASVQAARDAGLTVSHVAGPDVAALVRAMAAAGHERILHLCGADRRPLPETPLRVTQAVVYESAEADIALPPRPAVILVHSPRAGQRLARLWPADSRACADVVAISAHAAAAAGNGWRSVSHARLPRDSAMLELAGKLCQEG